MSFSNLYYKRTAGTAKACYVCYKPTTTVLATLNTVDFLYTCPNHLSDSGFATIIPNEPNTSAISSEEIAKVKAEWEEKQKLKKLEKEKAGEKDKDSTKPSDGKDASNEGEKDRNLTQTSKSPQIPGSLGSTPPSQSPSLPKHDRYVLHRDIFTMRQSEHRRRRQAAQAKELAPRLPGAPRGGV